MFGLDCEKCWEYPCECGYQYRDWSKEGHVSTIVTQLAYVDKKDIEEILKEVSAKIESREYNNKGDMLLK